MHNGMGLLHKYINQFRLMIIMLNAFTLNMFGKM
jgi:hypothetical protein